MTARAAQGKLRPVQIRLAVRRWLSAGLWSCSGPEGVSRDQLNKELRRLVRDGIIEPFAWECDGIAFALRPVDDVPMAADVVYRPGPLWGSYTENAP